MTEPENDNLTESPAETPPPVPVHPILKAWRWTLWALRWLGVIVFSVLFFVGVYLEIPSKMLICLAIIPIVSIFFPKKVRSWVWVCMTGVILGIFIWVLMPEMNRENWKAYQFDNELEQILLSHSVPDANNAAIAYQQILSEYDETIFEIPIMPHEARLTQELPWDPNEHQKLEFWLGMFQSGLDDLQAAAKMKECRFQVPCDLQSINMQMKRNNQLRGWVRLLIRSANRDIFMGNHEQALEKYLAGLSMAQHLYQQQTLFGQAGGFDIELLVSRALESYIIEQCQDSVQLRQIENAMLQLDLRWARCWPDILLREKLIAKNIAALFYEVNKDGKIRMSRNVIPDLIKGLGHRPQRIFVEQEQMSKVATVAMWLILPYSPEKLSKMIDERFDYYSHQIQDGQRLSYIPISRIWILGMNCESVIDWAAMQRVGFYWALDGQHLRHKSIVNTVRIFAALKKYRMQHNQWPEGLEDLEIEDSDSLIDHMNGKSFYYKRSADHFIFYSLGPNGIDDGGVNAAKEGKDDIVLWPRQVSIPPAQAKTN